MLFSEPRALRVSFEKYAQRTHPAWIPAYAGMTDHHSVTPAQAGVHLFMFSRRA